MDKAKAAVSSFLHKDGKSDTTVSERVNPAVTHEHITPTRHENVTTAIDKEVHQDHHHTTVQPVTDREVLPEKHSHQVAGTQHKEIRHGDDSSVRAKVEAEAAKFKNTREVDSTQHTTSSAPSVAGTHVHHHVHETIQPVVQKETIQPSVVHTTVPVHEVHHNQAKHHTTTALPTMSMSEFEKNNGSLTGRDVRTDAFAGEPRTIGNATGTAGGAGYTGNTSTHGTHSTSSTTGTTGTTGLTGTTGTSHNSSLTGNSGTTGTTGTTGFSGTHGTTGTTGLSGTHGTHGTHGTSGTGITGTTGHSTTDHSSTTTGKPSLMDKLNPWKDTDHDGKSGVMD